MLTGFPVPESRILASAIIALFTFIGNYLSRLFQQGIQSFRNDIAQQDWFCNGSEDPNVLWTDWKTKFLEIALDSLLPVV